MVIKQLKTVKNNQKTVKNSQKTVMNGRNNNKLARGIIGNSMTLSLLYSLEVTLFFVTAISQKVIGVIKSITPHFKALDVSDVFKE